MRPKQDFGQSDNRTGVNRIDALAMAGEIHRQAVWHKDWVTFSVTNCAACIPTEQDISRPACDGRCDRALATVRKRNGKWQVQVRRRGAVPVSRTFETKSAADRWARDIERNIDHGGGKARVQHGTVAEMVERYELEMAVLKPIGRSKQSSIRIIKRGLGHIRLADLDPSHIIRWARERRAAGIGPSTMLTEVGYLGTIIGTARALWRWQISDEPVREARKALSIVGMLHRPRARQRRPTQVELDALMAHWAASRQLVLPMPTLVSFAIASAMRLGEIVRIRWADLDKAASIVTIRDRKDPRRKAGNDERVPLLGDALGIILQQPETDARIFPYRPNSVSAAFMYACAACGIDDLHFHDLRHEGVSRLFEAGFSIEQVAMVSGHKDWRMLRRYTQLKPEALVTMDRSR